MVRELGGQAGQHWEALAFPPTASSRIVPLECELECFLFFLVISFIHFFFLFFEARSNLV